MRWFVVIVLISSMMEIAWGNDGRQHIRRGNELYNEGQFIEAEVEYRRALEIDPHNRKTLFNLGNALYRQERFEEAADLFQALAETGVDKHDRSGAYHNLGNARLAEQKFAESVDAYKNALRINPGDDNTRYNLAYAMQFLQDPPPQDQQSQDQDDQGEDDQQQQDQQQQDQQQDQEQDMQQPQPQQSQDQLTQQEAERILNAMNQEEEKVQENINRNQQQQRPSGAEKVW